MAWPINRWYVAGWDREVDRAPPDRTICEVPVVLHRKFDRSIVAPRDACPHRPLPLLIGFRKDDSIRCRYHNLVIGPYGRAKEMPRIESPPFWRDALRSTGLVDRRQICHFLPPSSVLIDVGVAPVGASATPEGRDQGARGMVIDALTPQDETHTHYFRGMARNFDVGDAGFTARLKAQQRSIAANPQMKLRAYSIDQGRMRARQVMDRLIGAGMPAA